MNINNSFVLLTDKGIDNNVSRELYIDADISGFLLIVFVDSIQLIRIFKTIFKIFRGYPLNSNHNRTQNH